MPSPEPAWDSIAARAEARITALVAAYQAGRISAEQFQSLAATVVSTANGVAAKVSDLFVTGWLYSAHGVATTPLGLTLPPGDAERLEEAFTTITSEEQDLVEPRAKRVARAEPRRRGITSYQEALRRRGVTEYRRVVRPDACEDCAPLAGQVLPIDQEFQDHPYCKCSIAPVTSETWSDRLRGDKTQLRKTVATPTGPVRLSSGLHIDTRR